MAQRPPGEEKEKPKGEEPAGKKEMADATESKGKPAEEPKPEKRNKWNPANWFKGSGPKPEPEALAKGAASPGVTAATAKAFLQTRKTVQTP